MLTLQYSNEDDRAYGLAGMAISLASIDALDRVVEFSIDAEGPMVTFSSDYYHSLAPAVSPKAVWENLISNFHITTSMVLSNLMARSLIRLGEEIPDEILSTVYNEIKLEGEETCGLEEDEVKRLYDKTYYSQRRIFGNPRLRPAIGELARVISLRRRLSGGELRDAIDTLGSY